MYSKDIRKIYEDACPAYLQEMIQCPSLERLDHVAMNCGMNYTHTPFFLKVGRYTRLDHSLGCALILDRFTHDRKQAAAGLLHDISTPVFSHVIDFARGDYLKEESTEEKTEAIIRSDRQLVQVLAAYGLDVEDVKDYHRYPLADNDSPKLSSDRLECTLSNALNYNFTDLDTIRYVYDDLCIDRNEEGEAEIQFRHRDQAVRFEQLMLQCTRIYTEDDDRYGMEILARLINDMLRHDVITEKDLYVGEEAFIARYFRKGSMYYRPWRHFTSLIGTKRDPAGIAVNAKKRWINPLVRGKGRLLDLDPELHEQVEAYRRESFAVGLKGVYEDGK